MLLNFLPELAWTAASVFPFLAAGCDFEQGAARRFKQLTIPNRQRFCRKSGFFNEKRWALWKEPLTNILVGRFELGHERARLILRR